LVVNDFDLFDDLETIFAFVKEKDFSHDAHSLIISTLMMSMESDCLAAKQNHRSCKIQDENC
jgi:hypothetical protein